jgi:periplasmic divalent cation tolerance protein
LSHILVLTTLPDRETARGIAQSLVDARLAACCSIGAAVTSMYHWRGATETADEVPLTVKTRAELFDRVAAAIRSRHPYELPEIVAVPISDGAADYLAWIDDTTRRV